MHLTLFSDGGSRGNPGKAAGGFVVLEHDQVKYSGGKYLGVATNNVAEWEGFKQGLLWILDNYANQEISLEVFLDSKLVVEQICGRWKVKQEHLKPLFEDCTRLKSQFKDFQISHVYRHLNKLADAEVNKILDEN